MRRDDPQKSGGTRVAFDVPLAPELVRQAIADLHTEVIGANRLEVFDPIVGDEDVRALVEALSRAHVEGP